MRCAWLPLWFFFLQWRYIPPGFSSCFHQLLVHDLWHGLSWYKKASVDSKANKFGIMAFKFKFQIQMSLLPTFSRIQVILVTTSYKATNYDYDVKQYPPAVMILQSQKTFYDTIIFCFEQCILRDFFFQECWSENKLTVFLFICI